MKALPVNLLAASGGGGKAIGFVLLALTAVAILAMKNQATQQPKQ